MGPCDTHPSLHFLNRAGYQVVMEKNGVAFVLFHMPVPVHSSVVWYISCGKNLMTYRKNAEVLRKW